MNYKNFVDVSILERVFKADFDLDKGDLFQILFHRDGPKAELIFNMMTYPSNPPNKWKNFNTLQINLIFSGVSDVKFNGWDTDNLVDFIFSENDGRKLFVAKNNDCEISFEYIFCEVSKLTPYLKE